GEVEDVARERLRVGVLLDEEAECALGGGGAVLDGAAVRDHEARGHRLQTLLLGERRRLPRRAAVAGHHLAPRLELRAQRGERAVHVGGVLGEGRGLREGAGSRRALARARGERGGQRGHLAVEVGGGPVLAQVLERLGARVAGHVAQPPGIALLPVLEAVERELVEVVAGGVLRGREAVGVVLQVPGQVGEDLEQVLVGREGAGRVPRGRRPRDRRRLAGFEVEIADALARRLEVRAEFAQNDWQTLIPSLERGDFDVALNGIEVTPARRARVAFTRPYFAFTETLVVRREDGS